MYFLAHMFTLLKAMPNSFLEKDELLLPMIYGCWAPDAGYFPFFSWQLRRFSHVEKPTINPYENALQAKAFKTGWRIHLTADELVHTKPFFDETKPLCPPIVRNRGLKKYFETARIHLGREVGIDLLIKKRLLEEGLIKKILVSKKILKVARPDIIGWIFLQRYVYRYLNIALPFLIGQNQLAIKFKKKINFTFLNKEKISSKIHHLLEEAIKETRAIIKEEFE